MYTACAMMSKANLISATEMDKLSNNAKKLLLEDLEKLKKNGYILPGIKNKENILLDGNTGLPKLINFDTLRKATSPTEINDIMNSVKSL
jgi:serine/threonine protein kinase